MMIEAITVYSLIVRLNRHEFMLPEFFQSLEFLQFFNYLFFLK
jgi:hypothetical protein